MISSHNGFSTNNDQKGESSECTVSNTNSRLMNMPNNGNLDESILSGHKDNNVSAEGLGEPSYTPVRRNPGQAYQR